MTPPPFTARLEDSPLVLDGAIGTQLYERGLPLQHCFDLANFDKEGWVREIHESYIEAGAQAIHTNTFSANRLKLARHEADDQLAAINRAGVRIARDAAADGTSILGSVGPLGVPIEPLGRLSFEEARELFAEQIQALVDEGVDALSLETFSNVDELVQAVRAARAICDLPLLTQITVNSRGQTMLGTTVETFVARMEREGVNALGLNCSEGPRPVLETALSILELTDLPVSVRPNAGMPRDIDGRLFYQSDPDYFQRFARRFLQAGGRVLGGCCGTGPEHIRAMARAARAVGVQEHHAVRAAPTPTAQSLQPKPLGERSALGAALAGASCPVSIELLPPRTCDMTSIITAAQQLKEAGATCINLPDGPRASARVSALATAAILEREADIETLLHFCCRDRNLLGMQSDLMGAYALGLRNLLVITGDPPYQGNYPEVTAVFDADSIGLCNIVRNLNHGLDLGGNEMAVQTHFCSGVALNPTALDSDRELHRFAWKVKAGIDFAITQPIFALEPFLEMLAKLPAESPPILAGIWPLQSLRNAEFLRSEVPGVTVPDWAVERIAQAESAGRAAEEGVAIAIETVEQLTGHVAGFQVAAPFNKIDSAVEVLKAVDR